MDKLSKAQKDEFATSFAILALYDGGVSVVVAGALPPYHSRFCLAPWWPVMAEFIVNARQLNISLKMLSFDDRLM